MNLCIYFPMNGQCVSALSISDVERLANDDECTFDLRFNIRTRLFNDLNSIYLKTSFCENYIEDFR